MRGIIAGVAALIGLAGPATAAEPEPIEVMVVGTYHFDNPGLDIYNIKADDVLKPRRQRELEALADALAAFRPTKIMVERVATAPDLADPRYAQFTPADLGRNRDERVQIGYRLAHRLGHKTVYAIDEQPSAGEPDYFPFGKLVEWAKANGQAARLEAVMSKGSAAAAKLEADQKRMSIPALLLDRNRPRAAADEQRLYYELLTFGGAEQQPGADLNAMWYLRNAKIFGKLHQAARPGDRVLVIYGTGHNYWLRHFAEASPGYRNIDPTPYLQKAAAAAR